MSTDPRPTPYLRVDIDRLRANVARAAGAAVAGGVALRPHAKTHKSADIARLQLEAGAVGLTVATVGEAEAFAAEGVADLFIAYPLWLTAELAGRLRSIASSGVRLAIGVDSVAGARTAAALLAGSGVEVLVEVDCGHHRSGVEPASAGQVALAADDLPVRGVYTFPGHSYSPDARAVAARDEGVALAPRAPPSPRPGSRSRSSAAGRRPRSSTPTPRS